MKIAIRFPPEVGITAESVVQEIQIPLLPASKIGSGVLAAERIPDTIARISQLIEALSTHEQALDPHPQYAKDSDLATHASDQELHLHDGAIANAQVAANAAIDWSKISKVGAAPGDVGAAAANHSHSGVLIDAATAPTAPTVGQRWRDTTDYQVWYWTGLYWMSEQVFLAVASIFSATGTSAYGLLPSSNSYNFYLLSLSVEGLFNSPQNTTDYWNFQLERRTQNSSANVSIATLAGNTNAISSGSLNQFYSIPSIGLHQDLVALVASGYRLALYRQGAGGSLSHLAASLTYRRVKR